MVARININDSIRGTFNYNDRKVSAGVADLLAARNYPMDLEKMDRHHRLNMLLKLAARNTVVSLNSVHISLNFAPGELLPQAQLRQIADDYMQAIGFGDQPYLVYQHFDAGHPHLHLVSVKVDADGDRMETHLGRKLNDIRREIEAKYGLVRADQHQKELYEIKPLAIEKVCYGKVESRKAVRNILLNILPRYNYTSIGELDAILRGYNITADIGSKESRIRKHNGLVYRILDPDGLPVGVPIPASRVDKSFTLSKLEERFLKNKLARVGLKPRVKYLVDLAFKKYPRATFTDLQNELSKSNIRLSGYTNEKGQIFGLTYVDYSNKIAFNGNFFGKNYTANGITKRCFEPPTESRSPSIVTTDQQQNHISLFDRLSELNLIDNDQLIHGEPSPDYHSSGGSGLFEILARGEVLSHWLPYELRKKKRRWRKRKPNS